MKRFKLWFAKNIIKLCDYGLSLRDGANDQEEVNELISIRNKFINVRKKLEK